jgi:hypothetical protein
VRPVPAVHPLEGAVHARPWRLQGRHALQDARFLGKPALSYAVALARGLRFGM